MSYLLEMEHTGVRGDVAVRIVKMELGGGKTLLAERLFNGSPPGIAVSPEGAFFMVTSALSVLPPAPPSSGE